MRGTLGFMLVVGGAIVLYRVYKNLTPQTGGGSGGGSF